VRALAAVVVAGALLAAPAEASQLVYACGAQYEDLCVAGPDGQNQRRLTRDGRPGTDHVYRAPALSRDGRRLAYVVDSDVFIRRFPGGPARRAIQQNAPLLIRFRGDGARFAVAEISAVLNSTALCSYNTDLSGNNEGRYCLASGVSSGFDYLPSGRLVMARSGGSATNGRTVVSLLRPEDGGPTGVERDLLSDPVLNLESPAVSPDGRFAAVVRTTGGVRGEIALYDLTTGALVRLLTNGPSDAAPSFAPDGSAVAFDREGAGGRSIWVVPVSGGRARREIPHGRSVSWGGGGAELRGVPARVGPRRLRSGLPVRVTGVSRGTRLSAVLSAGGRTLAQARATTRRTRGRLVLRVSDAALARLGRRARLRLRVRVRGAGVPRTTLRRTLTFRR
jgi:hypothetical protein